MKPKGQSVLDYLLNHMSKVLKKTLSKAVHMTKIFTNRIQSCSLVRDTHELYPKLLVWQRY